MKNFKISLALFIVYSTFFIYRLASVLIDHGLEFLLRNLMNVEWLAANLLFVFAQITGVCGFLILLGIMIAFAVSIADMLSPLFGSKKD